MESLQERQYIPVIQLGLVCLPRYSEMWASRGVNLKSCCLQRQCRPTSPLSEQAADNSMLHHPKFAVCHSGAAVEAQAAGSGA